MPRTILEKMFLKSEYSVAFLHMPQDIQLELPQGKKVVNNLNGTYDFILGFYIKKEQLEKEAPQFKNALDDRGLLWIAYPKGKLLETDLNRDILHGLMHSYGLDGVSIVSIDTTWSAMRFKK